MMASATVIISVATQPTLAIVDDVVKVVSKENTDITQQWRKLEINGLCTFQNASKIIYMSLDKSTDNPKGVTCGGDKFQWIIQNKTIHSSTEPSKAIKMVAKDERVKLVTYDATNSSLYMWDITEA